MKIRTIEEIHDKEIGHKKFALFIDNVMADNHEVSEIREYNDKFKFKLDGYSMEFNKDPNIVMKKQLKICYQLLYLHNKLRG